MKRVIINTALLTILTTTLCISQDRGGLIQLNESLGDTLDYNEMQTFNILNLKDFNGFQNLVLYIRNDTTLAAVISYKDERGSLKDSTLLYNARTLGNIQASLRQVEIELANEFEKQSSVIITDNNGMNYSGVIKSLKDDEIYFMQRTPDTYYNSTPVWQNKTFHKDEIHSIFIKGESKALSAAGYGGLAGFLTGALLGLATGNDETGLMQMSAGASALAGGVFLGAVGAGIGLIIGLTSSTSDTHIVVDEDYNLEELNEYVMK